MTECCETCRFFRAPWSKEPDIGQCRRFPPTVPCMDAPPSTGRKERKPRLVEDHGVMLTSYPLALADEWCGEWRAADMEEARR